MKDDVSDDEVEKERREHPRPLWPRNVGAVDPPRPAATGDTVDDRLSGQGRRRAAFAGGEGPRISSRRAGTPTVSSRASRTSWSAWGPGEFGRTWTRQSWTIPGRLSRNDRRGPWRAKEDGRLLLGRGGKMSVGHTTPLPLPTSKGCDGDNRLGHGRNGRSSLHSRLMMNAEPLPPLPPPKRPPHPRLPRPPASLPP